MLISSSLPFCITSSDLSLTENNHNYGLRKSNDVFWETSGREFTHEDTDYGKRAKLTSISRHLNNKIILRDTLISDKFKVPGTRLFISSMIYGSDSLTRLMSEGDLVGDLHSNNEVLMEVIISVLENNKYTIKCFINRKRHMEIVEVDNFNIGVGQVNASTSNDHHLFMKSVIGGVALPGVKLNDVLPGSHEVYANPVEELIDNEDAWKNALWVNSKDNVDINTNSDELNINYATNVQNAVKASNLEISGKQDYVLSNNSLSINKIITTKLLNKSLTIRPKNIIAVPDSKIIGFYLELNAITDYENKGVVNLTTVDLNNDVLNSVKHGVRNPIKSGNSILDYTSNPTLNVLDTGLITKKFNGDELDINYLNGISYNLKIDKRR